MPTTHESDSRPVPQADAAAAAQSGVEVAGEGASDRAFSPRRRVAIFGGTGGVGEGIVRQWLETGADVVVVSRSQPSLDELRGLLRASGQGGHLDAGRFHGFLGDYETLALAEQLTADLFSEFGAFTDIVTTVGGWWGHKPLWEVNPQDWQRHFVELAESHLGLVGAWIPRLSDTGSFQMILGGSATIPVAGSGIMSMEQAALKMMHEVLMKETGAQRRVFALILGTVQTRVRPWVDPSWISADEVGRVSVALAENPGFASRQLRLRNSEMATGVLRELGVDL